MTSSASLVQIGMCRRWRAVRSRVARVAAGDAGDGCTEAGIDAPREMDEWFNVGQAETHGCRHGLLHSDHLPSAQRPRLMLDSGAQEETGPGGPRPPSSG